MSQQGSTFGEVLRAAREAAGVSQGYVAERLGAGTRLGTSFLSDVEHDRRALAREYWPALAKALPTLTLVILAAAELRTRPVKVDAAQLTSSEWTSLCLTLARLAEKGL